MCNDAGHGFSTRVPQEVARGSRRDRHCPSPSPPQKKKKFHRYSNLYAGVPYDLNIISRVPQGKKG